MAKKSSIQKEKRRENLVQLYWERRAALKKTILDMTKSEEERMAAVDKLNCLPKNSSKIRLRNRCQLTGRSRGYYRKFQMSRICFRELASAGMIPGVIKASW